MSQIKSICFNSIINSLTPNRWYTGYDFLGKYTDDILYAAQKMIDNHSIFEEFPKHIKKVYDEEKIDKKMFEALDSRFGLFTFNYDEDLRRVYYDVYFHTASLIDDKSLEIRLLDELMEKYMKLPEVLASEQNKNQLLKYIDGVRMSAKVEEENLEILRNYYATNNNTVDKPKFLESELAKEKAYNILNSIMLKEESFDLIITYAMRELKNASYNYRMALYDFPPEELYQKPN